jgi:hypothetical protein
MASGVAELVAGIVDRVEGRRTGPGGHPADDQGRRGAALPRPRGRAMARAASHGRASLRPHVAAPPGRLERHGSAAPGSRRPDPDGARGIPSRRPDVVVDSRSVRAERGGELTGPDPTDRGEDGTEHHAAASTDGLSLAAIPRLPTSARRASSRTCRASSWSSAPLMLPERAVGILEKGG